jgi:multiple sugar transport system substrate-binding protein
MIVNKARIYRGLIIKCLLGLLAGGFCWGLVAAQIDISGPLSVRGFNLPDEIASVRVDEFKQEFPDVVLDLEEGSLDQQQFLTAVASGNPPEVIYINRDDLSTYATRGALEPLDTCISSQAIDTSQYREAALSQVTVNGQVYGVPEFFNIIVLILNDKALTEAGLTPDDVSTTDWDKLSTVNGPANKS